MAAIDHYINDVFEQGGHEAQQDGSTAVEAHHLLLAIAAGQETDTRQVLTSVGLDHQAIRDALDKEFEHSLRAAGVSLAAFDLPRPSRGAKRPSQMGASTKLAIERSFASVSRKKDLRPVHLLLGIVQAQVGTVPRALALAGVDQANLIVRILDTLPDNDE